MKKIVQEEQICVFSIIARLLTQRLESMFSKTAPFVKIFKKNPQRNCTFLQIKKRAVYILTIIINLFFRCNAPEVWNRMDVNDVQRLIFQY